MRATGLAWLLAVGVLPVQAQSVAFWRALEANDVPVLRAELQRGANPNEAHPENGPAIVAAARAKAFDVVRLLASLDATRLDAANAADETALMIAALLGDRRSVDTLIQRGAAVNRPGWAPLHYAATGGQLEIVRVLLEQHAFIDAHSPNLTTPLMMAARMRALPVVQFLVEQGADPSLRNQAGLDAVAYLEKNGEKEWAGWMRERVRRYVARYGTVEQPRWTESAASPGSGPPAEAEPAAQDMNAVPLTRAVSVAEDAVPAMLRPPASASAAPATPGRSAGVAVAPAAPPSSSGGSAGSVGSASAKGAKGAKVPASPTVTPPGAKPVSTPSVSGPGARPGAQPAVVSQPASVTRPGSVSQPTATFPVVTAPRPPTASPVVTAPRPPTVIPPGAPRTTEEPLFFSRTLVLPADPPLPTPGSAR